MGLWFLRKKAAAILIGVFLLSLCPCLGAFAQETRLVFIRDAEIEAYLSALAAPIFRAADIDPESVTIAIVQNRAINAFVAEGMNEFFYTGLLQATETPEQLAGIIAHETGHISGGHLVRGREELRNASAQAVLATILAVAAGAVSGNSNVAAGGALAGAHIAERGFLSFSRAQESSADAAALKYLDRAGISSRGLVEFFNKLANQELLPRDRQDEYVRTHPLTQDRINAVQRHLDASPLKDAKVADKFYVMHERMKAKLMGFLQPETALLRYADNDPRITARYARAIALYRTGKTDHALDIVDRLIKQEPENPFFHELKGQIQFENGRIEPAIASYKKANDLLPRSSVLLQAYGHALLENKDAAKETARLDQAIQILQEASRLDRHTPMTWRFLARAWGRKAEKTKDPAFAAMATYALAEEAVAQGNDTAAGQLADRAMKGLSKGSVYWLRAQDIKLSTKRDDSDKNNAPNRRR